MDFYHDISIASCSGMRDVCISMVDMALPSRLFTHSLMDCNGFESNNRIVSSLCKHYVLEESGFTWELCLSDRHLQRKSDARLTRCSLLLRTCYGDYGHVWNRLQMFCHKKRVMCRVYAVLIALAWVRRGHLSNLIISLLHVVYKCYDLACLIARAGYWLHLFNTDKCHGFASHEACIRTFVIRLTGMGGFYVTW